MEHQLELLPSFLDVRAPELGGAGLGGYACAQYSVGDRCMSVRQRSVPGFDTVSGARKIGDGGKEDVCGLYKESKR